MTKRILRKQPRVAIIGATGIVGRELIRILEERSFKLASLSLFASKNSLGEIIQFKGSPLVVKELTSTDDIDADLVFFAAGSKISLAHIEKLRKNGCICIDKSSAYRMKPGIPLIIPEVNGHLLKEKPYDVIASPNCVATPLVMALASIARISPLEQVVVSTYQAVSGAGQAAVKELEGQVRGLFNLREVSTDVFDKRIAFNLLPFIPAKSHLDQMGKTEEEQKLIEETKKILALPQLLMEATCVRVPVFNGHSMSVSVATSTTIKVTDALDSFMRAPGIIVVDQQGAYPTPLDACGEDVTLVGRLRPNTSADFGLSFWISSDNLRTGAALNAVRIAETIMLEQ